MGESTTLGVRSDGTLWTWGNHAALLTSVGSANTWTRVARGMDHNLALRSDGTLWAWGQNIYSQLGDGTTSSRGSPVEVGNGATWSAIACGSNHNLALRTDGTLWAWGNGYPGQLGLGSIASRSTPTQVAPGTTWTAIAAGDSHSMGIRSDGSLWGWGYNLSGQIGNGSTAYSTIPVRIGASTAWSALACGSLHTVASRTDGTLWAWGSNQYGQLGDGMIGLHRTTPMQVGTATNWAVPACGKSFTTATRSDGTLWSWGYSAIGQLGNRDPSAPARAWPLPVAQALQFPAVTLAQGVPAALSATASSGLPVTYTVVGPATLNGNILTPTAPGPLKIAVYQMGSHEWRPAESLMQTVQVTGMPEIELSGNGVPIGNLSAVPDVGDHTDFGSLSHVSGTRTRTFTLTNSGSVSLTLGGVTLGGAHAADFGVTVAPAAMVAAGGSTSLQITFSPRANGLRIATVTFSSNDADEGSFSFAIQGTGTTPPSDWRQTYFSTTANAGTAADTYDADGDGLVNLVEYAFGLSPVAGGSVQLPQAVKNGGSFTVDFVQPAGVTGVSYGASYSPNLLPGSWVGIPDTGTGGRHVFSAPVGVGDAKMFIRLEVTSP